MTPHAIPFNRPYTVGTEAGFVAQAIAARQLAGDGPFTTRCHAFLREFTGAPHVLLTHSCTAALEMAALLTDIGPGDEVILPSFTFSSTANAFALRGASLVFVDIREDTLNLDESALADAITPRTRAIVPVHYAGVACEMTTILALAATHGIVVVEDAAQGVGASWRGRALGTIGDLGCLSFHESKNIIAGEGGALLLNDDECMDRAEIIREKGTDRSKFFRGEVDKYTWRDLGSSYLPSEMVSAFLLAQFEQLSAIQSARLRIWSAYHDAIAPLEREGLLRRPVVPPDCQHNAHLYAVRMATAGSRDAIRQALLAAGVRTTPHYVPLHSAPAGRRFGRSVGELPVTEAASDSLLRLPLWPEMLESDVERVASALATAVHEVGGR